MATLSIVRGLPGSGKSTFAKKNFQCCILENDQLHMIDGKYVWNGDKMRNAIETVKSIAKQILSLGADVCVANTFTKAKYLQEWKEIAKGHGAKFEVYHCIVENTAISMTCRPGSWKPCGRTSRIGLERRSSPESNAIVISP